MNSSETNINPNDHFYKAVKAVFNSWTAFKLAVAHDFGGPSTKETAEWFLNATYQWIVDTKDLEDYELEEFFEDTLNNEFNTILDDRSARQIARLLLKYYELYTQNKISEIETDLQTRFPNNNNSIVESSVKQGDDSSSEEEGEDDDDEPMDGIDADENNNKGAKNVLNEEEQKNFENLDEGWTFVTKSGKHLTK